MADEAKVTETKHFLGHTKWVRSVLFFAHLNRFASCADDSSIRFWNFERKNCEGMIKHDDQVNNLMKWNEEDEFLSCSSDGTIALNNARTMERIKIVHSAGEKCLYVSMMRISSSLILVGSKEDTPLIILNVNESVLVRELVKMKLFEGSKILKSSNFKNQMMVALTFPTYQIKMFDYEQNFIVRTFRGSKSYLYAFTRFINKQNEEIIVAGGNDKIIYFFNTALEDENPYIKFEFKDTNLGGGEYRSFHILKNRFLFSGDYSGNFFLFDLHSSETKDEPDQQQGIVVFKNLLFQRSLHSKAIYFTDHIIMTRNSVHMVTSSYDNTFKSVKIECGLFGFVSEMEMNDLNERIEYLQSFIFQEEEEEWGKQVEVIKFKMLQQSQVTGLNLFKSLF